MSNNCTRLLGFHRRAALALAVAERLGEPFASRLEVHRSQCARRPDRFTEVQHQCMAGLELLAAIVICRHTVRLGQALARRWPASMA